MKRLSSIALWVVCASAPALAAPAPQNHPHVGQLAKLTFAAGSAQLVLDADRKDANDLDDALTWARAHPDGLIVLDGHADPTGTRAHNERLSLQRAKAVRQHLVASGANPEQIVIAAFGTDAARRDRSVIVWGTRAARDAVAVRSRITER